MKKILQKGLSSFDMYYIYTPNHKTFKKVFVYSLKIVFILEADFLILDCHLKRMLLNHRIPLSYMSSFLLLLHCRNWNHWFASSSPTHYWANSLRSPYRYWGLSRGQWNSKAGRQLAFVLDLAWASLWWVQPIPLSRQTGWGSSWHWRSFPPWLGNWRWTRRLALVHTFRIQCNPMPTSQICSRTSVQPPFQDSVGLEYQSWSLQSPCQH